MKLYCFVKLCDIAANSFFDDNLVLRILCLNIYAEYKQYPESRQWVYYYEILRQNSVSVNLKF